MQGLTRNKNERWEGGKEGRKEGKITLLRYLSRTLGRTYFVSKPAALKAC
jgi:hypothetical protein